MPPISKFNKNQAQKGFKRNRMMTSVDFTGINIATQTNIEYHSKSTQTNLKSKPKLSRFQETIDLNVVCSLVDVLKGSVDEKGQWKSKQDRIFSTIIYMLLRYFNVDYKATSNCMDMIGCTTIYTAHSWASTIFEENDPCLIFRDKRGGYEKQQFYIMFPDLELKAKAYSLERASQKNAEFSVLELAKFITEIYQEETGFQLETGKMVRSESSCKLDLLRWGAKWDSLKKKPYFEGHERPDVVEHRDRFISYFTQNKETFYQQIKNENTIEWHPSSEDKPHILLTHYESTYKSNETQTKRWFFDGSEPFFNKGQGKGWCLSYFLVQSPYIDLFELDETEWAECLKENPQLNDLSIVEYEPRSANAGTVPSKDTYFTNETICEQFERLFVMLKYKRILKNHIIDLLVDNARTHTAKKYDLNLMSKKSGTNCPYETIEWEENGETFKIDCFFDKDKKKVKVCSF